MIVLYYGIISYYISYMCIYKGNHLSDATCLTQVLFESGEPCGKAWLSLTRRNTHTYKHMILYYMLLE